jgi:hypothetical protein
MNPFALMIQQLHGDARACLQAICSGHGRNLSEMEAAAGCGPMRSHLRRLIDLDLVLAHRGRWQATWLGWGVHNWSLQLLSAEPIEGAGLPELRAEENGDDVVPGCPVYRPVVGRPAYCWCGQLKDDHPRDTSAG